MRDTNSQNKKAKLRAESKYIKKEINHRLKKREEKEIDVIKNVGSVHLLILKSSMSLDIFLFNRMYVKYVKIHFF